MRDNGNGSSGSGGAGQIRPVFWSRTEHQVASHESFAPEGIALRDAPNPTGGEGYTLRLAEPPAWTYPAPPCTTRVPKDHARDPYDTSDKEKAKALCAGCPVRQACLDEAMEQEMGLSGRSRYLVRGGLTPHQRGRLGIVQ